MSNLLQCPICLSDTLVAMADDITEDNKNSYIVKYRLCSHCGVECTSSQDSRDNVLAYRAYRQFIIRGK